MEFGMSTSLSLGTTTMKRKATRQYPTRCKLFLHSLDSKEFKGNSSYEPLEEFSYMGNPPNSKKIVSERFLDNFLDDSILNRIKTKENSCKGGFSYHSKNQGSNAISRDIISRKQDSNTFDNDYLPRKQLKISVQLYREILDKLLQKVEKSSWQKPNIHLKAAMVLRNITNWLPIKKQIGSISGVEIGDEFKFRAELCIVGIHHHFMKGIDYVERDGTTLATSVIVTSRYANTLDSDVLIYLGEGGNPRVLNSHPLKDQVLKRGNLALKNSMEHHSPVRVVYQTKYNVFKSSSLSQSSDRKTSKVVYVYDGLYLVEKYWQTRGEFGKNVLKFQMRRIARQSKSTRGFASKANNEFLHNESFFMKDISKGKEKMPINVVNTLDDKKPLPFVYYSNRTYPISSQKSILSSCDGCDCTDGCSDSEDCSCKIKNGKMFMYDYSEELIGKNRHIYECGANCKCFESCINRVSQRKFKFQLEVFKTELKGWGVRSKLHIPVGSFICEYVGEVLKVNEANQRNNMCDYLFDIENNEEGEGYTIDASRHGNVGRFINHSCFPNLYVQSVVHGDHVDKFSHIMLFAMRDIPPLQELTYDYKHRLGEIRCKNGDFKRKECNCESANCIKMFYE
ncbi:histone-lysine N-methyltransferase, H3 lysine-9 specific SUVH5-like [Mercurialis annua]|uniref:histone-lysine N-methyltransferase, H3 lysine-9 specific SUVH5-like n=1 Tax=Mercurialis annua TaxID=3986 RepID=UPI00215F9348|nr:histone-lysine N-methyltransferase, H3 lysine-9 specific SUVH5-like [Mercurialis annua]